MFNEEGVKICGRYTLGYQGHLFEGDASEGYNFHDFDDWNHVHGIYATYQDFPELDFHIRDNEYGVTLSRGEWY